MTRPHDRARGRAPVRVLLESWGERDRRYSYRIKATNVPHLLSDDEVASILAWRAREVVQLPEEQQAVAARELAGWRPPVVAR